MRFIGTDDISESKDKYTVSIINLFGKVLKVSEEERDFRGIMYKSENLQRNDIVLRH